MTLSEALARALEQSPVLAASSWELRVQEGRAVQAGLRPNPALEAEVEDFGGTGSLGGFDASESTLLLAQRVETAGKRPKRARAAEIGAQVAAAELEAERLQVVSAVGRAFAEVLAAQERVALTTDLLELAQSSVEAVTRLTSAGASPQVERTRADLEVAALRVELAAARRALGSDRADLAATWGGTGREIDRAEGSLGRVASLPPIESLREALARSPLLARWDREIERRRAIVELEDARRVPDVTVAAGVRRNEEVDETAFVAGVSVPLPLFDRNEGDRAAARADVNRAREQRRAAEAELRAALDRRYQELAARHEELEELRGSILPSAQRAFEGVRSGYAQGLFQNVDVLDAQRRLFELRLREIDALLGYRIAVSEVERLAGISFDEGSEALEQEQP